MEADMHDEHQPDITLLARLVGQREARRLYRGALSPLFVGGSIEQSKPHEALAAARELVWRWLGEDLRRGDVLQSPTEVRRYLQLMFAGEEREIFVALFLDGQNRLIVGERLCLGTLSQTSVYPREVVRRALALNAGAVIFAHNHPSGVAEPSRADELLTRTLKEALSLVDIRTLDHFVIAGNATTSFAERGLL
jgi:DNA repair protein RadC